MSRRRAAGIYQSRQLEPERRAEFVVLTADALADMANKMQIAAVWREGWRLR